MALPDDGVDREFKKFKSVGLSDDKVAIGALIYGIKSDGVKIPIKVVDDGSGYGKLVTSLE